MTIPTDKVNTPNNTFKDNVELLSAIQEHFSDNVAPDGVDNNNHFTAKSITISAEGKTITITPDGGITIDGVAYINENDLEYNQVLLK